jgi:hypothetical protein
VEDRKKLVLDLGTQVLRSEASGQSDNRSHLIEVLSAMRTAAQMGIEAAAIACRQRIVEVVRDKLDDLLAREGRAATKH